MFIRAGQQAQPKVEELSAYLVLHVNFPVLTDCGCEAARVRQSVELLPEHLNGGKQVQQLITRS